MYRKIIVKRKTNSKEKLVLTLDEFKKRFAKELKTAIDSYTRLHKYKHSLKPPFTKEPDYESDFYFDMRFNYNHNAPGEWYIADFI
ncbi:hypothetical protein J6O86_02955 [bacterium]|nr:hypothetical protein [bacterium]